jgi:general secretion pathway protein D
VAPPPCSASGKGPACQAPAEDLKAARQAFGRGLKLEKSRNEDLENLEKAFYEFEEASRLVPGNVEYLRARELARQDLAREYLERGNGDLLDGRQVEAMAEFQTALNLDPQNEFAQQRVNDALGPMPARSANPPQVVASADVLKVKPLDAPHDIHYRGDSRGLLTAVAASFGLTVIFDDSFPNRQVRFDLDNANFATAMQAASAVTKSFSVAVEDTVLYVALDSPENHRLFDRMGMRSF